MSKSFLERHVLLCFFGFLCAAAPGVARADNDDDKPAAAAPATPPANEDEVLAQAKAHFQAGRDAFTARNYPLAAAEFRKAEELRPSPILHYNIGLCFEALGKKPKAVAAYQKYLAEKPDAENRAEVEARIAGLSGTPAPAGTGQPENGNPSTARPPYQAPPAQPQFAPGYIPPDYEQGYQLDHGPKRGYKLRRNWSLFAAGTAVFGGLYLIDVLGGIYSYASGGNSYELFIPLVGPLIYAAHYNANSNQVDSSGQLLDTETGLVTTLMVFDFLGQAAGIAMAIAGACTTKKVPVWAIMPYADPHYAGLSAVGRF